MATDHHWTDSQNCLLRSATGEHCTERKDTLRAEKLIMEPYFGHFAGQRLVFDPRKTESAVVSLKVKAEDQVLVTSVMCEVHV